MKEITLFSDGSCYLNDNGRGGWGCLLIYKETVRELYGGYTHSTNNRMELMAILKGLQELKEPCIVKVFTDSKYIVDPINEQRIIKWFAKDFKGIKNSDLWKALVKEMGRHTVEFNWVKGHNNGECPGNERADVLAEMGASSPDKVMDKQV